MGKTTLARKLAKETGATHLRVDTVENQLGLWGVTPLDDLGYRICYELAKDQLSLDNSVIADTVNPIEITRKAWQKVCRYSTLLLLLLCLVASDCSWGLSNCD